MIRLCDWKYVLRIIRLSGVAKELEELLAPGRKGRPRPLSVEVFLAAFILTAWSDLPLTLTNVRETMTKRTSVSLQNALGIRYRKRPDGPTKLVTIRRVRYLFDAIEEHLVHTQESAPELADQVREQREKKFHSIIDQMIASTIPANYARQLSLAIDGSGVESFAKSKWRAAARPTTKSGDELSDDAYEDVAGGESVSDDGDSGSAKKGSAKSKRTYSADPDARAGYRTKTYSKKSTFFFGYDMTAMVGVPNIGGPDIGPSLLMGLRVLPAAKSVTAPAIELIDQLMEQGYEIDEVIADRAYSHKRPEHWAQPLFDRKIDQVLDLHPNDRGPRYVEGTLMLDGRCYCDQTPEHLWVIDRPARFTIPPLRANASEDECIDHARRTEALAKFSADIAELAKYESSSNAKARPRAKDQGKKQFICAGNSGSLNCTACRNNVFLPEGLIRIKNPPMGPNAPKQCRQSTVMIPGSALIKLCQRERWGSPAWIFSYARRNKIEGFFGQMRNADATNINRGWWRVYGLIKTTFMLTIVAMATNLKLVREWARREGVATDPRHEQPSEDFGFEELGPDGEIVLSPASLDLGPPD